MFQQSLQITYYKQAKCKGLSIGLLLGEGEKFQKEKKKKQSMRKEDQKGMEKISHTARRRKNNIVGEIHLNLLPLPSPQLSTGPFLTAFKSQEPNYSGYMYKQFPIIFCYQ